MVKQTAKKVATIVIKYLFAIGGTIGSWLWQNNLLADNNFTAWIMVYGMFYFFVILLLAILTDEFVLKGDSLGEIAKNSNSAATFFTAIILAAVAATFIASTFITDPFGTRSGLPIEESTNIESSATFTPSDTLPYNGSTSVSWSED